MSERDHPSRGWSFLTNHAYVVIALQNNPTMRQRDIASLIGITEGAVQRILRDLIDSGHVDVERNGRRNQYRIQPTAPMRHPLDSHRPVTALLALFHDPAHENASTFDGPAESAEQAA